MVGVLLWMLAEMPRQDKDLAAAVAIICGSLTLGAFPGGGIWSQVGGMAFGLAAKLANTLAIGSRSQSCTSTMRTAGIVLGLALLLAIGLGLGSTSAPDVGCVDPDSDSVWCLACEDICFSSDGWCSSAQLNRCA